MEYSLRHSLYKGGRSKLGTQPYPPGVPIRVGMGGWQERPVESLEGGRKVDGLCVSRIEVTLGSVGAFCQWWSHIQVHGGVTTLVVGSCVECRGHLWEARKCVARSRVAWCEGVHMSSSRVGQEAGVPYAHHLWISLVARGTWPMNYWVNNYLPSSHSFHSYKHQSLLTRYLLNAALA